MSDILKIYKICTDNKCLKNAIISKDKNVIITILDFSKIVPDEEIAMILLSQCNYNEEFCTDLMEVLIDYGLCITYNILDKCTMMDVAIDDLDRFKDIKYDEQLYYIFHKYEFWPEKYVTKLKENINSDVWAMREMCTFVESVDNFKIFLINKKLKPDRYCLENSYINESINIKKYLLEELNCEPTTACLGNKSRDCLTLNKLLKKYKFDYKIMSQPYNINLDDL